MNRFKFSLRVLLIATSVLAIFIWWFANEISNGRRDAANLDYLLANPESPLLNAQFESGYVFVPSWIAENLGWACEPFERVVEIDFRLDNLSNAKDIAPYTVFEDVKVIRIDALPENARAIREFSKFKKLNSIYVSRFTDSELAFAAKILASIEIKPAE